MFNQTNKLDQELELLAVALHQQKEIRLLREQADRMLEGIDSKKQTIIISGTKML